MTVEVGQPAPDFTLPAAGGGEVSLAQLKGKKVIVYFYPKADTPGCTKEACGFNDALPNFGGVNADQCVLHTLADANFLGYDTLMFEDASATTSPDFCMQATLYNVRQIFGFTLTSDAFLHAIDEQIKG